MSVAQGLYEGVKNTRKRSVGLITYMRTDSTRISEVARAAKEYIEKNMEKHIMKIDIIKQKAMHKMHTKL